MNSNTVSFLPSTLPSIQPSSLKNFSNVDIFFFMVLSSLFVFLKSIPAAIDTTFSAASGMVLAGPYNLPVGRHNRNRLQANAVSAAGGKSPPLS